MITREIQHYESTRPSTNENNVSESWATSRTKNLGHIPQRRHSQAILRLPQLILHWPQVMSMMLVSLACLIDTSFISECGLMYFTMIVTLNLSSSNAGWKICMQGRNIWQLDYKSCEMMADDCTQIAGRYPDRAVWIEVAEDGENGALIKYEISRPSLSIKI
jgi:hypothetical protein